jgi:hypothetical protein
VNDSESGDWRRRERPAVVLETCALGGARGIGVASYCMVIDVGKAVPSSKGIPRFKKKLVISEICIQCRILDVKDDLSWALFFYSGAASVVGQSYTGAVLYPPSATPSGLTFSAPKFSHRSSSETPPNTLVYSCI